MEFKKINAPSLKEVFIGEMENLILSGKLEIGTKLPPERELAESMQVSRAVINAGISEMANKGFLEIHPRKGTFISDYRRNGTVETLISLMKYNGGTLKYEEIVSILELRLVIDRMVVEKVSSKITAQEIAVLETKLSALKKATTSEEAAEAVFNFIHELYIMSDNTIFPLICTSFREPIINLWKRFCDKYGVEALIDDNSQLLSYIKSHDTEAAINHLNYYIGETLRGKRQIYSE